MSGWMSVVKLFFQIATPIVAKLGTGDLCANTQRNCRTDLRNFDITIFLRFFLTFTSAAELSRPMDLLVFTARRVCIARTRPWQDVLLSVCLSVRLSHAGILSKRLYISSKFFHHRVASLF